MNFFSFFTEQKSKIILATFIFLILGLMTRFYHLEEPKAVVFDEFHFFHFVTEYEKEKYFFDIHPPLGKLILWGNAKMYGLEEYVNAIQSAEETKKDLEENLKNARDEYLLAQKNGESEESLALKKSHYEAIEAQKKDIETKAKESYEIGRSYNDTLNLFGIRSVPAFFGAITVPLLFLFALLLTQSFPVAVLIGGIATLDSALITESQYVLMDSMLIFSILASSFFAVLYAKNPSWKWWIWVSVFSAIAVSIKWTGMTVIGFAGIIWLWSMIKNKTWIHSLLHGVFYWGVIATLYIGSFWIHFAVLSHSGEGDAFHTPEFRKTLIESVDYKTPTLIPMNFWGKFIELNTQMGERSAGIRNEHPFSSRPEDWVKGEKAIYFWSGPNNLSPTQAIDSTWNATVGKFLQITETCTNATTEWRQQIHLFANPVLWRIFAFLPFLGFIVLIIEIIKYIITRKEETPHTLHWTYAILGIQLMALANIIPFVLIERPQFLYHAFEWAMFSLLLFGTLLAYLFQYIPQVWRYVFMGMIMGMVLVFFVVELPLMYGFSYPECLQGILSGNLRLSSSFWSFWNLY